MWKQTLYAFVLRQALGPMLTAKSRAKLSECIEVSFQEGTFVLKDIELDPHYCSNMMKSDKNLIFRRVRIGKLEITLSTGGSEIAKPSWTSTPRIQAKVDLTGLRVDLGPDIGLHTPRIAPTAQTTPPRPLQEEVDSSKPGYFSSYMDAALSSLKIDVKDVVIRILNADDSSWIGVSLNSASYYDMAINNKPATKKDTEQVRMHKIIDFCGVSCTLCHSSEKVSSLAKSEASTSPPDSDNKTITLIESEGVGQASVRVLQTITQSSENQSLAKNKRVSGRVFHDVNLALHQQWKLCFDVNQLCAALSILNDVMRIRQFDSNSSLSSIHESEQDEEPFEGETTEESELVNESLVQPKHSQLGPYSSNTFYQQMNDQYVEARQLAQDGQLKGGVLIPRDPKEEKKLKPIKYPQSTSPYELPENWFGVPLTNRTPNLEYQQETDDDDTGFDAFFDCTDRSFSAYLSLVRPPDRLLSVKTRVTVHLTEVNVQLTLSPEPKAEVTPTSCFTAAHAIHLTIVDVNYTATTSDLETASSIDVSQFEMDYLFLMSIENRWKKTRGSLARFIDEHSNMSDVVTAPPCINITTRTTKMLRRGKVLEVEEPSALAGASHDVESDAVESSVEVHLLPIEITYQSAVTQIFLVAVTQIIEALPSTCNESPQVQNKVSVKANEGIPSHDKSVFTCNIPSIAIFIPTPTGVSQSTVEKLKKRFVLIQDDSYNQSGDCIGLELTTCVLSSTKQFRKLRPGEHETKKDTTSQNVSFSMASLCVFYRGKKIPTDSRLASQIIRLDVLTLSGLPHGMGGPTLVEIKYECSDLMQDANYYVAIDHDSAFHHFPLVRPISLVKAPQEKSDNKSNSNSLRGQDPQLGMVKRAEECDYIIEFIIPMMVLDISVPERHALLDIVSKLQPLNSNIPADEQNQIKKANREESKFFALALKCHRAMVYLHENQTPGDPTICFVAVGDDIKLHSVFKSGSGMSQARCLAHDFALYKAQRFPHAQKQTSLRPPMPHLNFDEASALVFRSKIGKPLSSEIPSLHIDVIVATDSAEGDDMEVHFSFYDVTHRFDLQSDWTSRLAAVLSGKDSSILEPELQDIEVTDMDSDQDEASSSCIKRIFLTCTDCNIDYKSPLTFENGARAVARVGELYVSSILVSGATMQAFKISMADFSLFVCNSRYTYNFENAFLVSSRQVFPVDDLTVSSTNTIQLHPFEDTMGNMGFVALLFLDCADVVAKVAGSNLKIGDANKVTLASPAKKTPIAKTTVDASLGQVDLYACKDSFTCLTSMIGDISLFLTALPEEQIEAARMASTAPHNKGNRGNVVKSNTSSFLPRVESDSCLSSRSSAEINGDDANILFTTKDDLDTFEKRALRKMILEGGTISLKPFSNIPDSELSAKELRQKYGIIEADEIATSPAKSPLIKNYYTLDSLKDDPSSPSRRIVHVNQEVEEQQDGLDDNQKFMTEGDFLLDGYEWTTVDHGWSRDVNFNPDAEQHTQWFPASGNEHKKGTITSVDYLQIFPNHAVFDPVRDPLAEGDMNASKLAGLDDESPLVQLRFFLRDLSLNCRFFDGHDWVLPASIPLNESQHEQKEDIKENEKKSDLLGELLGDGNSLEDDLFAEKPKRQPSPPPVLLPKLSRQEDKFFEFAVSGVRLRLDSFDQSPKHRLASCLDLKIMDFFLSESISNDYPAKLLGEWINEKKHPRDADDGMLMMKMATMHPKCLVSQDGKIANPIGRVTLQLLPLRAHIDQHALRFILRFFSSETSQNNEAKEDEAQGTITENSTEEKTSKSQNDLQTFFEMFFVKPCKLKVNYRPVGVDSTALREGSYAELLNLFSLEDMSLLLKPVEMQDLLGWGAVISEILRRWIEDICSTQLHKFLSGATPFHPISNLGGGVADLVLMPVRHYKKDRSLSRGLRKGTTSFAGTVAVEALNTTSRLTKSVAKTLSKASPNKRTLSLPTRPEKVPHTVGDTAQHAFESLSRGIKTSTYMIVVVPRREYKRKGATGAVKSVVRGIPVALLAPISGASEALSYTLVGVRNQMRPDIRKEEEARHSGLRNRFR